MRLTPLQREYLSVLAAQPEGWFTATEAAWDVVRARVEQMSITREQKAATLFWRVLLSKDQPRARRVLHRLADRGLVNRSGVGVPPGAGELRFKVRRAGVDALGRT
jgi:hypothetical protein